MDWLWWWKNKACTSRKEMGIQRGDPCEEASLCKVRLEDVCFTWFGSYERTAVGVIDRRASIHNKAKNYVPYCSTKGKNCKRSVKGWCLFQSYRRKKVANRKTLMITKINFKIIPLKNVDVRMMYVVGVLKRSDARKTRFSSCSWLCRSPLYREEEVLGFSSGHVALYIAITCKLPLRQ